jgi:D-alanyl-D-alanine carboxypeptidase/D-alanyl-D-alanine-endopeptidase (penicillin-binding protein 4)
MQRLVTNLIRASHITALRGRIVGDESYFDPLRGTAPYGFRFSPDVEGSLSALAYNRGLIDSGAAYVNRPGAFAASQLAGALRAVRVKVPKRVRVSGGRTPADAQLLATVHSPRMATLIQWTNTPSDNFFAEMLLKGLGAKFGGRGSTAAGAAVVRAEMASEFGIDPTLNDGSGLSRTDATSPRDVVTLLTDLETNEDFVNSLAVAGETGTLEHEMRGTVAQGNCRGKTGTLRDVANLAGYCQALDGHTLAFAFLANYVSNPDRVHTIEAGMAVAVAKYDG